MITLGEFLDDLEIGKRIAEALSILLPDESITDEKLGDERLGQKDFFSSMGPTLIALTIILALLFFIVLILTWCRKRSWFGEKISSCVHKL